MAKFQLGMTVATPGALEIAGQMNTDLGGLLLRHSNGDWGTVCLEDKQSNDQALIVRRPCPIQL